MKISADQVYNIVKKIPRGKVSTYGDIARFLGSIKFARAVGVILKKNPRPIEVPCHRVVKSNGSLGGYSLGGPETKRTLLIREGIEIEGNKIKNFDKYRVKL